PALHPGGQTLGKFFADGASNLTFAIGPEGDWTEQEMKRATDSGFVALHLGKHVLRSETAALHVLSAAAHHYHGGVGGP
ncbi:MAG: RsmE family RNA methyltransferase, partial [Chthoniobacterales bacterium]